MFLEFGGYSHRQPVDAALARRITGTAIVAEERERAGVDDRAAALLQHLRRSGPTRLERRTEVRVDQVAELCTADREDRLAGQPGGVPAQFTKISIWPNCVMQASISASATAGSAGEPGNAIAPAMH